MERALLPSSLDGMSTTVLPPAPEMYRALCRRDAGYEGIFVAAIRTTGVFCRPTCPARKPRPENVEFFDSAREALRAGYRPCRRCRPADPAGAPPPWLRGLLGELERAPGIRLKDADLRARGLDPARVRRWFRREHGLTFQAWQRERRLGAAHEWLREGEGIDAAAFSSGFESVSGFRDAFARLFDSPPGHARGRARVAVKRLLTPLGPLVAGATDAGVCLVEFADPVRLESQLATLRRRLDAAVAPGDHPHLDTLEHELERYFAGDSGPFQVPRVAPGTPFEEAVWSHLCEIPYGETRSYAEVAAALGRPRAARAVGRANGHNRIAILIPCHRVVRSGGSLGGYGGGLWRKRYLLALEQGTRR